MSSVAWPGAAPVRAATGLGRAAAAQAATRPGPRWPLPVRARNAAAVRASAQRILAERQFHPGLSIWQRVVNWLDRWHLSLGGGLALNGSWLGYLVLALLACLAAVVLTLAVRRGFFRSLRSPAKPDGLTVSEDAELMTAAGWRRQADLLAAEGRYREALRCRYRALVAELAGSGVVEEVPGRTCGDYERLVGAAAPDVSPPFSRLTRVFELCWYGGEPSDAGGQRAFDEEAAAIARKVASP